MKQSARCGMLLCKGQQNGEEETAQERMALSYSRQMQARNHNMVDQIHPSSPISKQIFSFKLNSFRKYEQSDKNRQNYGPHVENTSENTAKMSHYLSSEKKINRPTCVIHANQTNIARFYCSPPSRPEQLQPERRLEKMSMMFRSVQINQPVLSFKLDKAQSREVNDAKSSKGRISEMQTNLGNETERTLIDCLKEENTWDIQTEFQEDHYSSASKAPSRQPLHFKNQQHYTRIGSPVTRIPTVKSSHIFIQHNSAIKLT